VRDDKISLTSFLIKTGIVRPKDRVIDDALKSKHSVIATNIENSLLLILRMLKNVLKN
jgi:hypothetical protein